MKGVNIVFHIPIFPFTVMFSLGETDDSLFTKLKRMGMPNTKKSTAELDPNDLGKCVLYENNLCLIRTNAIPKTADQYATLHHEIFHAVSFMLQEITIKLDKNTEEVYAYLTGYITRELYKKLK